MHVKWQENRKHSVSVFLVYTLVSKIVLILYLQSNFNMLVGELKTDESLMKKYPENIRDDVDYGLEKYK